MASRADGPDGPDGPDGGSRLPVAFADRTRGAQVLAALVAPVVLGVVAGLALGWSAPAYWLLQVVATVGGVLAGTEHDGARPGAKRGALGGGLYGAAVLLVHYATGADAHVSLGSAPAFLVVITAVAGAILGAGGGMLRARVLRGIPAAQT